MFLEKPLIAIDVGSSSVKVCELDRSGSKLKQLGVDLFRGQVVIDGEIKEPETVRDTINGVFKKMKLNPRGRRASIAIGGSGVLIKRALIQPEAGADLVDLASYEASQAFPYEMDDLYTRYAVLGKAYHDGRVPMALVGARRSVVEQYITLIHSVGLKTGVVDCNALALANMFDHNYPVEGAMVVLVSVGCSTTQVVITYSGEFLYTREVAIGGKDYNHRIGEALGVDYDNAENLKLGASLGDASDNEGLLAVLDEVNEMIAMEVQTTINFFFENEDFPPSMTKSGYVFVMGGSARVSGLDAVLAANLQMPVQIANPFQRIDTKSSPYEANYLLNQGTLYGASVGLALRRFQDDIS